MAQPILVFRTADNTEKIKKLMTPEAVAEMDARDAEHAKFQEIQKAAIERAEAVAKETENAITKPNAECPA